MKAKKKKKKVVMKTNYLPNLEIESSVEIIKMIGAEIKRRRVMTSRTLNDYDLGCSISYQSKIEHGTIIPKYKVLLEYCLQNGITQEELNVMLTIDQKIDNYLEQNNEH